MTLTFFLNGRKTTVETPSDRRVVDLLRQDLGLTGTKEGCGSGECGACTLLVDGRTHLSCLMMVAQLEGRSVTTIEGLAQTSSENGVHPVVDAFVEAGAVQCGFCTPGMVVTVTDLLGRCPDPDETTIRQAVSGNLCRCTGYQAIVDATRLAAGKPAGDDR